MIVHAKGRVRDRVARVGLTELLGPTGMYPTEESATRALVSIMDAANAVAKTTGTADADDESANRAGR